MTSFAGRLRTGLDRLLSDPSRLRGRRYAVLSHHAAVSAELRWIHLALLAAGAPRPVALFAPEHGFHGVEQDMIPAADAVDAVTGIPVASLYGDDERSLRPPPERFRGLDLLLVDLQDIGCRYYTYAATAVWATEAALAAGCEVWVLDRPNPLGGVCVEGNVRRPGLESFVGAFELPVRHGLTLGELVRLEIRRAGGSETGLEIVTIEGWRRETLWPATGRPWIAPSPNMPDFETALVYPGACLLEATTLSEGRGTTRPFRLLGAPGVEPTTLVERLQSAALPGVAFVPAWFRPQFQKHRGALCGGVELVVTDATSLRPYRLGIELLRAFREVAPHSFGWRSEPYEFVGDRPAIDLLTGDDCCRRLLDAGADVAPWLSSWAAEEATFGDQRRDALLYPEASA